ncbi:MAG: hypothetical protein ACE5LU_02525 [Anaerolineae bacterium]
MRRFRSWLSAKRLSEESVVTVETTPVAAKAAKAATTSTFTFHPSASSGQAVSRFTFPAIGLILVFLMAGWSPSSSGKPSPTSGHLPNLQSPISNLQSLSTLPIGMMVHPPSLDYFNKIARPDDIAGVPLANARILPEIVSGKRMVMSPSVELAEERAASFVGDAEYFGYNIEHWPDTPAAEQRDPEAAGHAAAGFARQHNLGYVVGPDLQFTEDAGADLAREADIYVIQGQRLQEDTRRFQAVVTTFAEAVRSGNPEVKVWVQVSASFGTPERTLSALQTVADHIDGIWIHYNPHSFEALQALAILLRPANQAIIPTLTASALATAAPASPARGPEAVPPIVTAVSPAPSPDVVSPTARTVSATPVATQSAPTASPLAISPPPSPTPGPAADSTAGSQLPLTGGAMAVLAVGAGGLVALGFVLGYLWYSLRR